MTTPPGFHLPLFTFMISRASWESVKGRPKARETPFLLCLNHIVLQGHKLVKKQELCCQISGWFHLPLCGEGLRICESRIQDLESRESWIHPFAEKKKSSMSSHLHLLLLPLCEKLITECFIIFHGDMLQRKSRLGIEYCGGDGGWGAGCVS